MGHCNQALVASPETADRLQSTCPQLPRVVARPGFVILPVDADFIESVAEARSSSPSRSQGDLPVASDLPQRWTTTAARESLARRFGLPYDHSMQDWEWEVADASRFGEFLDAYTSGSFDEDERFSLVEILIQCVEDMELPSVEATPHWRSVAALLVAYPGLHASSVRYWSCLGDRDLEDCFAVSGPMRAIWEIIRQAWDGDGRLADR